MKISHIKISKIMGIDELEFDAGQFNVVSGQNGNGKTSVIEAIKSVMKGGHDATLLRDGEKEGQIVFVLDDGSEITRRVTSDKSTTVIRRDGKAVSRPAEVIKALTDLLSVNPVDFLRAPKKDRLRVLLESMPLEADAERLEEMSGVTGIETEGVHALQVIDEVYRQVYDDRTGTNRAVKEKESTINQLRHALPAAPGNVNGSEDELRQALDDAALERDTMLGKVDKQLNKIVEENRKAVDAIRAKLQDDIDRLKAEAIEKVDAINAVTADNETRAQAARDKARDKYTEATAPVRESLAVIVANRDAAAKRQQSLKIIDEMEEDAERLAADAARQTAALKAIEDYKAELLADLPIPDLEIREGELFRGGVQFDRLNTAQQVEIAVELAKIRAGELGVICVDGIELLDSKHYDAFRESALASGLQLFVTRVNDSDFGVEAD